jgi:hypothetical protein
MTPDACLDYLKANEWSVGEVQTTDGTWNVFGHRGNEKILGRGPTESEAWQAATNSIN